MLKSPAYGPSENLLFDFFGFPWLATMASVEALVSNCVAFNTRKKRTLPKNTAQHTFPYCPPQFQLGIGTLGVSFVKGDQ